MAATGQVKNPTATMGFAARRASDARSTNLIRIGLLLAIAGSWEALARSGLLFRDVVPSLFSISAAIWKLLGNPAFYANLQVTAWEIFASLAIGSGLGIAVGIILGANRFLGAAFEPYVYYLAPTPRIIFFPVMIMWFGVGIASKIALGALSCFFTAFFFFDGPAARRISRSSAARSIVIDSTESPVRSDAFVVPSVT